jgi:hypothetical protein
LTYEDLEGEDVEVTIKNVGFGEVGKEKATKGIVFFEEFTRGMVVNRTNLGRIKELHGGETDAWVGKQVTLYEGETDFEGKVVPCIRVRTKEQLAKRGE